MSNQEQANLVAAELTDRFIEVILSTKPESLVHTSGNVMSYKGRMEEMAEGLAAFRAKLISELAKQPIPAYGDED